MNSNVNTNNLGAMLLADFYKIGHPFQWPEKTSRVYLNMTPRKSRIEGIDHMVFFGLQYFIIKYLMEYFQDCFFSRSWDAIEKEYREIVFPAIGEMKLDHIKLLHQYQFLPIHIKALREGTRVPMRVPCMTISNTHDEFHWLPSFLETIMSASIWQACTSATIAREYKVKLLKYAKLTGMPEEFVDYQGHDFSFRGMSSLESAMLSGMGHLLSFKGTDTIPAIYGLRQYYNGKGQIGASVPATEHGVMCAGGKECEIDTYERLITEIYPSGIISIVSDTWDLWKVLTEYAPKLKDKIMARDGKVVFRPDSGDPVDILCGDPNSSDKNIRKGVIELLWDVFGGTITKKGYKLLDSHVGAIYGDSITLDRCDEICRRLMDKGFASQAILGIGSYTYQHNTRDTFGTAFKATNCTVGGKSRDIFKCPVTDDGTKNSARGFIMVDKIDGELILRDGVTSAEEAYGQLKSVFYNGDFTYNGFQTLEQVRACLWGKDTNPIEVPEEDDDLDTSNRYLDITGLGQVTTATDLVTPYSVTPTDAPEEYVFRSCPDNTQMVSYDTDLT